MENTQSALPYNPAAETTRTKTRNAKSVLEIEVWKKLEGENLWLGPKGVMVNSAALEERKFFYNIVQVS
jgi:hypothetical protein